MADFCTSCHEKMNKGIDWVLRYHPWEYELGHGICEGCGRYRDDIVIDLNPSLIRMLIQKRRYYKRIKKGSKFKHKNF